MIYPDDAVEFDGMMNATWQSLQRTTLPEKSTKKYWFGQLQHFALGDVSEAFDKYIKTAPRASNGSYSLPSLNDITNLCKPKKDEFYKSLPAPLSKEKNKEYAANVVDFIAKQPKPKTDYHAWFKRILANPHNFPSDSVSEARRVAKEFGYVTTHRQDLIPNEQEEVLDA